MIKENNNTPNRVRRDLAAQLKTTEWAVQRFNACKHGNHDFADLPREGQELFHRLPAALKLAHEYYRNLCFERAEKVKKSKGQEDALKSMPKGFRAEWLAVIEVKEEMGLEEENLI